MIEKRTCVTCLYNDCDHDEYPCSKCFRELNHPMWKPVDLVVNELHDADYKELYQTLSEQVITLTDQVVDRETEHAAEIARYEESSRELYDDWKDEKKQLKNQLNSAYLAQSEQGRTIEQLRHQVDLLIEKLCE